MNEFYVYALIDPRNNSPFYVGKGLEKDKQGRTFRRPKEHLSLRDSSNRLKNNIIRKIKKLGLEITWRIFAQGLSEDDAFSLEVALIKQFGRRDINTGILSNLTDGGEGATGHKHQESTLIKMSDAKKAYIAIHGPHFKGCKHSAASRQKMSESQRTFLKSRVNPRIGTHLSAATKKKLSDKASKRTGDKSYWFGKRLPDQTLAKAAEVTRKKFLGSGNPFFGKKHSAQTRQSMSEKLRGKKMPDFLREKLVNLHARNSCVIKPDGRSITIRNLAQFCRDNSLSKSGAAWALKNKTSYRGWCFSKSGFQETPEADRTRLDEATQKIPLPQSNKQ